MPALVMPPRLTLSPVELSEGTRPRYPINSRGFRNRVMRWQLPKAAEKVAAAPRRVREIAWKAQTRLCRRFRLLERKGKRRPVVATAVARELAAFIWAINREVMQGRQA